MQGSKVVSHRKIGNLSISTKSIPIHFWSIFHATTKVIISYKQEVQLRQERLSLRVKNQSCCRSEEPRVPCSHFKARSGTKNSILT